MLSTWPRLSRQSPSQLWQKMKRGRKGERKRGKKTHSPTLAESMYIQPNSLSLSLSLSCLHSITCNVAYEQWLQKAPVERGQPVGVIRRKFMNFTTAAASLRLFEVCAASQPVI